MSTNLHIATCVKIDTDTGVASFSYHCQKIVLIATL